MKITLLVIALLVANVFAASSALALVGVNADTNIDTSTDLTVGTDIVDINSDTQVSANTDIDASIDTSSIASAEIESEQSNDIVAEVSSSSSMRKVGFLKFWRGYGSVNNNNEGHLASVVWASQRFALFDKGSKQFENQTEVRTHGNLKISGVGMYRLVRYSGDENSSTVKFYIIPEGRGKITSENAASMSVGTMTLTKQSEYPSLVKWAGTVNLNSGASWNIELATDSHTIRPGQGKATVNSDTEIGGSLNSDIKLNKTNKPGVRVGFWKRFFGRL